MPNFANATIRLARHEARRHPNLGSLVTAVNRYAERLNHADLYPRTQERLEAEVQDLLMAHGFRAYADFEAEVEARTSPKFVYFSTMLDFFGPGRVLLETNFFDLS